MDVSLLGTAMWTLSSDILAALGGAPPEPVMGRGAAQIRSPRYIAPRDDRHIQLMMLEGDRILA